MQTRRLGGLIAAGGLLILLGLAGSVGARTPADEPTPAGPSEVSVAISPLLQYQGRLTNPSTGQPVADGTYAMTFKLYDVASGGAPLWTEAKNVSEAGGLFSTALGDTTPLAQSLFNGQALWLGVTVGGDLEATPRQAVLPVAYALSLAPGAVISSTSSSSLLQVVNSTGNAGAFTSTTTYGVRGETASIAPGQAGVLGVAGWTGIAPNQEVGVLGKASAGMGVAGMSDSQIGVYGYSGTYYGVRADATGANPAVYGLNTSTGYAGYFYSTSGRGGYFYGGGGPAIYAAGSVTITGNLEAPRTRYVPITAGDLMHSTADTVITGDCCNGVLFPDGSQSGGSITFPLPDDYVPGTQLNLDLYLIPIDSGSGALDFFVRFVGLNPAGWSGTGGSYGAAAVSIGTINYVHKQSFALTGFSAGSLPELAELTIRRDPADTYAGRVTLVGLRLAYQASR